MKAHHYGEEAVSVAVDNITPNNRAEKVYRFGTLSSEENLYRKLGYSM